MSEKLTFDLLTEFDEERYVRTVRREAFEDGFRDGFIESFRETHKDCYDETLEEALLRIAYEPYDKLFEILSKEKRTEDLIKATGDKKYCRQLMKEFGIQE